MSSITESPTVLRPRVVKKSRRMRWMRLLSYLVVAIVATSSVLWASGYRPRLPWVVRENDLRTISADRGDVEVVIVESGSLESTQNATIKCQVEALLGLVGGAQNGANAAAGGRNGVAGQAGAAGQAGGANQAGVASQQQAQPATKSAGVTKAGAGRTSATTTTKAGASSTSASSGASGGGGGSGGSMGGGSGGGGGGGGGAGGGGAGGSGGSTSTSTASVKPQIQSFTMQVQPHVPLRGATVKAATTAAKGQGQAGAGGGGGGGRGGGGGGGGRGGQQQDPFAEKPGSTTILSIVPEGTKVKEGEVVCTLDAAAFRDELQAQVIRCAQAKSWVEQAKEVLKVSEISLAEYKFGIYPKDLEQIDRYITICETQLKQAQDNLKWSREMHQKEYLSASQLRASEFAEQQMRIGIIEAKGMRNRLVNFTGPKLIRNLEAKIASVRADLLAQESSFRLEDDRRRRIEKMIDYCTLKAPRDGMIAYFTDNKGPGWNPTAVPITEGLAVRQGQTIIILPDPTKMRVKVRVNESKYPQVHIGQEAVVHVEAFPDQPLKGKVSEITVIPSAANSGMSDVKLYFANVEIEGGFEGLRTGLSAQVAFKVASKSDVVRVPLRSIRWAGGEPFVAVTRRGEEGFDWKAIELGLIGSVEAEVVSGIKAGDPVVAEPEKLDAPPTVPVRLSAPVALGTKPRNPG